MTILCLLCGMSVALAAEASTVNVTSQSRLNLGDKLAYIEDTKDALSLTDVLSRSNDSWQVSPSDTPNFGYTDSAFWFRVALRHDEASVVNGLLAIQYPLLDHIGFYALKNGELVDKYVTGDRYPFSQRPLRHRDFLFPITLQPGETLDLYINMKTQGSSQLPIEFWKARYFSLVDQDEQLLKALYYGMMLLLAIYNLFLFVSIRERPYLYYVGLVLSVLVLMAGTHGFLYQYIYPDSPRIQYMSMLLAPPSTMLFASLFATYFLRLPRAAPVLNQVMNGMSLLFIACIVGAFILPYDISTRISVFLAIPASLVILFAGPYAWIKGQTSARYFTIAWAFLLSGIFITASSKFGFLPRNAFTEYALSWGSALEAILLSFALADRYNRERMARFRAQKERLAEMEQRKMAESRLYYQSTHQPVNGLPNMVMLQQVLHDLLGGHDTGPTETAFSLVFVHLNRFQEINKTLGHANADIILSLFSQRLERLDIETERFYPIEEDGAHKQYFAHIEGVIFAFILQTGDSARAQHWLESLQTKLSEPIEFNGMKLDLGLSIGIASYPEHGSDIATLIRHTRVAVDHAEQSHLPVAVYSSQINPYSARRLALMGELDRAIRENALELFYQPIIDCRDYRLIGSEALLRWNHPTLGFIPPDEFISLAEKTGIMRSLTQWVIDKALCDNRRWHQQMEPRTVSVNISAINLQEHDFVEQVLSALERYRYPAKYLILEVTETAVMTDPEHAMAMLKELSDSGVRIAIDDFGTGQSSFSYIRKLPVYEIKIDRSFVSEMLVEEGDQVIVRTTLNLAHDLGYKVVAEGVEDASTLKLLSTLGTDLAQGYHIARPMSAPAFERWVRNGGFAKGSPDELAG